MEEIDQEMCLEFNQQVLYLAGWRTYKDGEGLVWYCSEDQWSRQFPLFAIMSDNLKEKLQKLLDERWSVSPPCPRLRQRAIAFRGSAAQGRVSTTAAQFAASTSQYLRASTTAASTTTTTRAGGAAQWWCDPECS